MELINHDFGTAKKLLIMPVGDIQYAGDDDEVALGMLKRHIQWGVDHDAYFVGMGDYIDTFSPSNRERLSSARLYDSAVKALDRDAVQRVEEIFQKALAPSRGRWLGMLEGHHYHEFRDRTTSDQLLAGKLGSPFLGTSAYLNLRFQGVGNRVGDVKIWLHHGKGGGKLAGSALNTIETVSHGFEADIYLMGHQHKKNAVPLDYVKAVFPAKGAPRLVHTTKLLVVTGSFLKGYVVGRQDGPVPRGGYVEKGMLNPVALGGVLVKVRPRWSGLTPNGSGGAYWNPDLNAEV